MQIPIWQVDAFADSLFGGNPAAVCLLDQPADPKWMQLLGREMNLSETAFLTPQGEEWGLRWFTPSTEVKLCGHATLASAHVLWESGLLPRNRPAIFNTLSGVLRATCAGECIEMDFPSSKTEAATAPDGLLAALGAKPRFIGKTTFDYLLELGSAAEVRSLNPDFRQLAQLPVRGIIVTSRSDDPRFDFISRFFAPGSGVDEDPVTGSAHCALGPFWQPRLGKAAFAAWQASARGGRVGVVVRGDRVLLSGTAVTVFRGQLA